MILVSLGGIFCLFEILILNINSLLFESNLLDKKRECSITSKLSVNTKVILILGFFLFILGMFLYIFGILATRFKLTYFVIGMCVFSLGIVSFLIELLVLVIKKPSFKFNTSDESKWKLFCKKIEPFTFTIVIIVLGLFLFFGGLINKILMLYQKV